MSCIIGKRWEDNHIFFKSLFKKYLPLKLPFYDLKHFQPGGMKWKWKSCTALIGSASLFFELTYMLLQNNYINNGVTDGLK